MITNSNQIKMINLNLIVIEIKPFSDKITLYNYTLRLKSIFYSLSIFHKQHAAQLEGINCFFKLFLNYGSVFESFISFGITFNKIALREFSLYFIVLVPDKFTKKPLIN